MFQGIDNRDAGSGMFRGLGFVFQGQVSCRQCYRACIPKALGTGGGPQGVALRRQFWGFGFKKQLVHTAQEPSIQHLSLDAQIII